MERDHEPIVKVMEGEYRQLIFARCPSRTGRVPIRCHPDSQRARPARTSSAPSFVLEAMDTPREPQSGLPRLPPLVRTPQCRSTRESPAARCRTPFATSSCQRPAPRFIKGTGQEVLARCLANLAVLPLRGVGWNDLGEPRRVMATLARRGLHPEWTTGRARGCPRERGRTEPRGYRSPPRASQLCAPMRCHFLVRSSSPSAHARATAGPAFSCPGILSQPPFSMNSALVQLLISPNSLSFFS